jgi:hypothetical protein
MTAHDLWLEPEDEPDEEEIELDEPQGDYGGDEETGDYRSDEHERILNQRY